METKRRVNPLKHDAVTADGIKPGDRLIVWQPNRPDSRVDVIVVSLPYHDESDGGTMIIGAIADGREHQFTTSELGLTGDRYTGEWTHIAIYNEEDED